MIKIEKNLNDIPPSLKVPPEDKISERTHKLRQEVIISRKYPSDSKEYDKCYKNTDIKTSLKKIYNSKCAFCEQKIEFGHVEHFRPKKTYYWLAYSWSNLLYVCPFCNLHKSAKFEIDLEEKRAIYNENDIQDINSCCVNYDIIENPLFVHPERKDASVWLKFDKNGNVYSNDVCCQYTLDACKIHRRDLNDARKQVLDDLLWNVRLEIEGSIIKGKSNVDILRSVDTLVDKFRRDASENTSKSFLAFRRYIDKFFLDEEINEILYMHKIVKPT